MAGALTESDIERVFNRVVSPWMLEQLDTKMGTDGTVKWLKSQMSSVGGCGPAPDGEYSTGKNKEYWSLRYDQEKRGFAVRVEHTVRKTGKRTVLREGTIPWNNLANRTTIAACELRSESPPLSDWQRKQARKLGMTDDEFANHIEESERELEEELIA